jgi:hypothetical protein
LSETAAIAVAVITAIVVLLAVALLERAPYEAQSRKRPVAA